MDVKCRVLGTVFFSGSMGVCRQTQHLEEGDQETIVTSLRHPPPMSILTFLYLTTQFESDQFLLTEEILRHLGCLKTM